MAIAPRDLSGGARLKISMRLPSLALVLVLAGCGDPPYGKSSLLRRFDTWVAKTGPELREACYRGGRMSPARRMVEEYTKLLARAFNGAIEVDGQRIVAHPSGTLLAKPMRNTRPVEPTGEVVWTASDAGDRDNDWSDV